MPDKPDRFSEPLNTANFIAGHGWEGSLFKLNLPVTVLRKATRACTGIGNRPFARHLKLDCTGLEPNGVIRSIMAPGVGAG